MVCQKNVALGSGEGSERQDAARRVKESKN